MVRCQIHPDGTSLTMETEMSSVATAKVATREAAAVELRPDGENDWPAWRDHDAIRDDKMQYATGTECYRLRAR